MTILEAACKFVKKGCSILPTKPDKSPNVKAWKGVNIDLKEFNTAFGIGIKCGKASDGVECLDFDNHFGDAKKNLSEYLKEPLVLEIYNKYKLSIESTISGGFHMIYRCDKVDGNQKLASRPKWDEISKRHKPDAIIETRGEGGYFVVAPTEGYNVIRNDIFQINHISVEERDILINTAKSFNEWAEPIKNEYENKNKPGDYYNSKVESIDEMKSSLLKAGWVELNGKKWRRPNKKTGISATLGQVADNVFYCFTSNGFPFEPEKGYTPFQVVCLLDYNSDFKSFAKELGNRYNLNEYQNTQVPYNSRQVKRKTDNELENILSKSFIDVNIPIEKPPIILEINHGNQVNYDFKRLLTLGNLSCITGKGKSKKTFLSSIILSCFATDSITQHKFKSTLPENKKMIFQFDTEQSEYDTYIVAKRIHAMSGGYKEQFGTFNLREFEPIDRIDVILKAINKFKENIGFITIDGIADLINDINDVVASIKVLTMLMKWTKTNNIHITNIIHQNKNDNYATGHLGSALIKKAEVVIGVEKDNVNKYKSNVTCQNIRGAQDFEDFSFYINEDGIPKIDWESSQNNYNTLYT